MRKPRKVVVISLWWEVLETSFSHTCWPGDSEVKNGMTRPHIANIFVGVHVGYNCAIYLKIEIVVLTTTIDGCGSGKEIRAIVGSCELSGRGVVGSALISDDIGQIDDCTLLSRPTASHASVETDVLSGCVCGTEYRINLFATENEIKNAH